MRPDRRDDRFTEIRSKAAELAEAIGVDGFELTIEDIRFLCLCRALGFGEFSTVTVVRGMPAAVKRTEERIDLTKELLITKGGEFVKPA